MKKTILLFAFLGCFTLMAQAQKSCAKSCAKTCAKTAMKAAGNADDASIAKAATLAGNIERRQCADSGKVSYFRKAQCATSGKVSYAEVNYDASTAKFVNISPSAAGNEDMNMAKEGSVAKKACSSSAGKKACCAAAAKPGCCAGKAKAASAEKASSTKVKVMKVSESMN